jgi:hypothetical protein
MTTNHKRVREHITKKKLAFEIAKLVGGCIERIRVRVAFPSFNLLPTSPSIGRNGLSRYSA